MSGEDGTVQAEEWDVEDMFQVASGLLLLLVGQGLEPESIYAVGAMLVGVCAAGRPLAADLMFREAPRWASRAEGMMLDRIDELAVERARRECEAARRQGSIQ